MQHTVDSIRALLASNDRAVGRALVVLRNRQTADEQTSEQTKYQNGRGFRPAHAKMGTSMANFFERRGYLTQRQVAYWRAAMRDGKSRIGIYARQLLEEAEARVAQREAA
jgi:tRNA(Ile2) C34 agmatinyltransferase TiaS